MRKTAAISPTPSHLRLRRIVLSLLVFFLLLAACSFIYENIAETRDTLQNPMPGRLVHVAGSTMHINCAGQGTPTVILESGLAHSFISWPKVHPQIAQFPRVSSYHRPTPAY